MKQRFHSRVGAHVCTQAGCALACSVLVLSPRALFLYATWRFLFGAAQTGTLRPAGFCGYFFCPRLLLAAVSECVVGKCADLIGRLKKAVQQSDEEELEKDFD